MGWVGWVGDSALSYRIAYFGWGDKRGQGLGWVIIILWGVDEGKDQGHAWKLSQYAELRLREDIKDIIRLAGSKEKA